MAWIFSYFSCLLCVCCWDITVGLRCMYCTDVTDINDCLKQEAICKDDEEQCFLETRAEQDLSIYYTAGCRAKLVCDLVSGFTFGKRSEVMRYKKQLVSCSQCCNIGLYNGVPCNGYLCNRSLKRPAPTCAVCDQIEYPTLCHTFRTCNQNEVCFQQVLFNNATVVYKLGCQQKSVCDADLKVYKVKYHSSAGKRQVEKVCSACCEGERCNLGGCPLLVHNQTCYDHAVCG